MSLTRSEAILELGKKLISQLDCSDDLLLSWMAHHIAELIDLAAKASEEVKPDAEEACRRAIIQLWKHRADMPHQLRPMRELEPILRTIESLDPAQTDYRYYPGVLQHIPAEESDEETKKWLEFALGFDHTARMWIQLALRSAAERKVSTAEPWVELATQAGIDTGAERFIVKFALGEDEDEKEEDERDAALREALSKLDAFAELATSLAESYRAELDPAPPRKNSSSSR